MREQVIENVVRRDRLRCGVSQGSQPLKNTEVQP